MATLRYAIPGPGGSLGMCAICGDTFLKEILLRGKVDCLGIEAFPNANLPVHRKCGDLVVSMQGPWKEIREKFPRGPMFDCFEEEFNAQNLATQGSSTERS
jgi:hypothetical protein